MAHVSRHIQWKKQNDFNDGKNKITLLNSNNNYNLNKLQINCLIRQPIVILYTDQK